MDNLGGTTPFDHERTILAAMPMAQLVFGLSRGVPPNVLCQTAGVPPMELVDRDRFVPHAWYNALWAALRTHCKGVAVGMEFGKFMTPDHLGYAGQVFRNARDGLDALHKLLRFGNLFDSRASRYRAQVEIDDHRVSVMAPPEVADGILECVEAVLFSTVTQMNALLEVRPQVLEVHLHLTDQCHRAEYEEFFRCPIRFGCDHDGVILARDPLRAPLRGANAAAAESIEAYVAESFAASRAESFGAKLESVVRSQLRDGAFSQPVAARALGLSVRSLQRRLSKDGRSFAQFVEEVRRVSAVRMLRETDAAVYEVAFCLGYQDVSSFNRAFKRWLGVSPSVFREGKHGVRPDRSPSAEGESVH